MVKPLCISSDSQFYVFAQIYHLKILKLPTFEPFLDISVKSFCAHSIYSPDNQKILIVDGNHSIQIHNALNGEVLSVIYTKIENINHVEWPDDSVIIFGTKYGYIHILDANTFEIIRSEKSMR